jgi:hypothetical protein
VEITSNYQYACARAVDGRTECWGPGWGDGAATLDCTRGTAELSGSLGSTAVSTTVTAGWQFSYTDVPGYRFAYDLSDDANGRFGFLVFDGGTELGSGIAEQVLTDGQSVPVDHLLLALGETTSSAGPIYCSASGSTVKMHIDELSVDLKNIGLLGQCPGTPVSGELTICTDSGCPGISGTIDGATLGNQFEQYSGGGGGFLVMYGNDTTLYEIYGSDAGAVTWGFIATPASGPLGGAVYCVGGGSWTKPADVFAGATFKLTNLSKLGACPTTATGALTGCVR